MPTPQQLKAEIEGGALASALAPHWTAGNDRTVAAMLNAVTTTRLAPMRVSVLAMFLAERGKLRAVCEAKDNALLPAGVRDVSFLLNKLMDGAADRDVDPNHPKHVALLDALVSASVLSAADKAAWLTACTVPASRAEVVFGAGFMVSEQMVGHARNGE